jgi:hypothetical protein
MLIGRFEHKYALPDELAERVLSRASAFLMPDRGIAGPQRVTSLYLETPELTFYRWHNSRRFDRFKMRIRGYGEQPGKCVYVEIKRKQGDLVRKQRAEVALHRLSATLGRVEHNYSPALREFVKTHRDLEAQPKILLSCQRIAFRDTNTYGEIAVTVDRNIVSQPISYYDLVGNPRAWKRLPLPKNTTTIVELKYVHLPPAWMATLMEELASHRVRFSKYGTAMEQYVGQQQEYQLQSAGKQ